jgi:hypothetical protein
MTIKEYQSLQEQFTDPKVFERERARFFKEHPDCPKPKPIECLSLVMRKEYADEIIAGTKTVEVRDFSEYYQNRLYDKEFLAYEEKHLDD